MRFTDWMISAAEVSNLASFLAVVFSFTTMFFFIVRIIGEDLAVGGVQPMSYTPPRMSFCKILLPFKLKLIGVKEPYRLELGLTALASGKMRTFWGVDINSFHQVLRAPSEWFHSAFLHGNLFGKDKCIEFGDIQTITGLQAENEKILVGLSSSSPLQLGPAPRDVYPCVIVLISQNSALVTVFHIKDDQCSLPSQVLSEYYKYGESATLLQPIYVSSLEGVDSSDKESQEDSESENLGRRKTRCIICHERRITRVILPCRHANSCYKCFKRLQNCPMCRGYIQSYFLIGPEPTQQDETQSSPQTHSWRDVVRRVLRRLWLDGPVVVNQM